MTHWIEADDFVLDNGARLEQITFWDFEIDGYFAGTVVWQIYSDNGVPGPGQLLYSGTSGNVTRTVTGVIVKGFREVANSFTIVPTSLPAGKYWLGLHNGQLGNADTENFFWESAVTGHGSASFSKVSPFIGNWLTNAFPTLPSDLAFRIDGANAPHFSSIAVQSGTARLTFTTDSGFTYRVDYKNSLGDPSWTPLLGAESVAGSGGSVQVVDSSSNGRSSRFYRASLSYNGVSTVISAVGISGGQLQVSFPTTLGYYYRVEYKNNITDPIWNAVTGAETITGTGSSVQIADPDTTPAISVCRFYRVIIF